MLQVIAHRGPDDEGYYLDGPLGLGARRLSIIDLPRGGQPMCNEGGSLWIVYNGEIYNYQSLRRELEAMGHHFRTAGDTEVILHLYEKYGERCVERLSGMFALAIWDSVAGRLFLARDHLGQKPLFYSQTDETFYFASEVKAILAVDGQTRSIDPQALHHYLTLRFIPAPATMFPHVKKLPPAHYLIYERGRIRISRYWQLSFTKKYALPEKEAIEYLDVLLQDTVKRHLVSDVPVDAFLSGGMDSSMIVALMAAVDPAPFKTFAIGVDVEAFDELPYARQVAAHVGTHHVEECVGADLIKLLPRIVWHLDEPSDPIAACMYHAARLASRHTKVVLGGDGGDELFAGFDRYLGVRRVHAYARLPSLLRKRILGPVLHSLPETFGYKSLTQQARWAHQISLAPSPAERYALATSFFRFDHAQKQALFSASFWQEVQGFDSAAVLVSAYNNGHASDPLDRMLYTDYVTRLPEHSLMLTDRMAMAHGLEARSPFLDHELVENLAALAPGLKIRNGQLKYILRQLARRYLPQSIVHRPKQGFMLPVAHWLQSDLYGLLQATLPGGRFVEAGLFRREEVLRLMEEHRHRMRDHHVRLWMLLSLEIWYRLYVERGDVTALADELLSHIRMPAALDLWQRNDDSHAAEG